MKRPAIFFDRDNTLIASDGYLGDPAGVVLIDGAPDAVARARQYGFRVVTFSNQSGVARGMFTEEAVQAVNRRMDELLQATHPSAVIERHAYCPFHPEASVEQYREDSFLRKPKPGMILKLAEELNLDLARSWVVGDAPRDIEAGKAAGCRTVLFKDPKLPPSPAAEVESAVQPDFVVATLREAVDMIAKEAFKTAIVRPAAPAQPALSNNELPHTSPAATVAPAVNEPVAETPVIEEKSEEVVVAPETPVADSIETSDAVEEPAVEEPEEPAAAVSAPVEPAPAPMAAHPLPVSMPVQPAKEAKAVHVDTAKLESLTEQILLELRRQRHEEAPEFSVSKLLAGIVQVLVLAVMFVAYLNRENPVSLQTTLLFAIALQVLTVALLIMGKQR